MEAVEKLLEQLDLAAIPMIRVFNKGDLVEREQLDAVCARLDGIGISALDSKSFPPLAARMEDEILRVLSVPDTGGPPDEPSVMRGGSS
jgi:50S ribosomal subunit-associated GTPase HflX